MALYAQTDGKQHSTNSGSWSAIPGLSFSIPEGVGTMAIVTLNVPNPYAQGNKNPGGVFGISIDGTMSPVIAGFTYNEANPPSNGRVPVTVVVGVPLAASADHHGHVAERAQQQRHHRQPRDVVGDPRLEATAQRRKDKAGIDAGLVLFGSAWREPMSR